MTEERHDLVDRVLHAEELTERGIAAYQAVAEDARQPRVVAGVEEFGFADGSEHPLAGGGVCSRVFFAEPEIVFETYLFICGSRIRGPILLQKLRHRRSPDRVREMPSIRPFPSSSPRHPG